MAQNDEVKGISLNLTEEDIRRDCAEMKIPYSALMAVARRHKAQQTASSIADVLYVMMLAKTKGLNPIADNYSLIARPEDKGFSLTFNKEAALHVINNHPRVKKGAIGRRFIINGKGERIDIKEHPEQMPGGWKLSDIDWNLTAIFEIEAAEGGVLRGIAKFKNCFAAGRDGNPKYLWLKDPVGMTMKQAYKDLANVELDGALPDDDEREAAQLAEAEQDSRSLPAASGDASRDNQTRTVVMPAADPTAEAGSTTDVTGIIAKGATLGISEQAILAALGDQEKNGVTVQAFEASLQKEIDSRAAAKDKRPTRARKADSDAPPKPPAPKKEPKPLITVVGTIDAVKEGTKPIARKEGEPEKPAQRFLVISVNKMDMTVWHKSMFDGMIEAHESVPAKRVKLSYAVSGTGDQEYATVEEFEILDDAILEEKQEVEPPPPDEPTEEPLQEAPGDGDGPPAGGMLFNF